MTRSKVVAGGSYDFSTLSFLILTVYINIVMTWLVMS